MTDLIKKEKNEQIERLKKELEELDDIPKPEPNLQLIHIHPASDKEIQPKEDSDDDQVLEIQKSQQDQEPQSK